MRALGTSGLFVAGALALVLNATPAAAGYPGSTQPGADPVPPGNIIVLRVVPARNAIISGADSAVTVSTAPPSIVFGALQGVGTPLSDAEAASVTGALSSANGGNIISKTIGGVLGSESMSGGMAPDRAGGGHAAGGMNGAIQGSVGILGSVLGNLGGPGH